MQTLANFIFGVSGLDAAADLRGDLSDYARGSRNLLPDGAKQSRPFRGLEIVGASGSGASRMFQIKDTWGGLDDIGGEAASGSLFSTIADMLVYIGKGQVKLEDEAILGAEASGVLRFLLKWNGSYTDANSGPFAAGLPEPNAVQVGVISNSIYGAPNLTGVVSIKYARYRKTTGGRSRASATSAVLVVTGKAIFAVVPEAVAGQTHHIFFGTDTKLGGVGLHYRIARANPFAQTQNATDGLGGEYTEADVQRTVAITGTASTDILQSAAEFSAGDIGKRVEALTGFTVPAGTVVAEILSPSQIRLSNPFTPASGAKTCDLIAYAGGIDRSVVLNWTPSDLIEETAWIYDFAPPTGSHAFQLENRMFVAGGADAAMSSDADNPGTMLIGSIPNQFESFDPRFPVYLPESVVDILSDGMESYKFIGGRNGIYAAQYLNVERAAPLTLSILLRGEGIATPHNWCARERAIYLFSGKGQPVRIVEGGKVDLSFGARVKWLMRDWNQEDVIVSGHPAGGGVVYSNGTQSLFFDEATERWSTLLSLNDFYPGVIVSAANTRSELLITLEHTGVRTAYKFDKGTGSFVAGISQYVDSPNPRKQKIVQGIRAAAVMDQIEKRAYLGIHINTLPTDATGSMTAGNNIFTAPDSHFNSELVGSYILVKSAGAAGGFLFGRILAVTSATTLTIGTPEDVLAGSIALNAAATVNSVYALIGLRIFPVQANRKGTIEVDSGEMFLNGISSFAASFLSPTSGTDAQPLEINIVGTENNEEGWALPSAVFAP